MTVAELIKELNKYDGSLEVGGSGHFGEILKIEYISIHSRENERQIIVDKPFQYYRASLGLPHEPYKILDEKRLAPFVCIGIEWAGNEPD